MRKSYLLYAYRDVQKMVARGAVQVGHRRQDVAIFLWLLAFFLRNRFVSIGSRQHSPIPISPIDSALKRTPSHALLRWLCKNNMGWYASAAIVDLSDYAEKV
jgi:hypothetical protein